VFVDGNNCIGMYIMLTFLEVKDIPMDSTNEEAATVGPAAVEGSMPYKDLLVWVRDHASFRMVEQRMPAT